MKALSLLLCIAVASIFFACDRNTTYVEEVVGPVTCAQCHDPSNEITGKKTQWEESVHGMGEAYVRGTSASCAGCHSGNAFALRIAAGLDPDEVASGDPNPTRQDCRACHRIHETYTEDDFGLRSTSAVALYAVPGATFNGGEGNLCVNCHQDVDNDFFRVRRHPVVLNVENSPTATQMHCTDCHDVHAGEGPYMLTEVSVTDTCLHCHIGKGGPFRYPHMAVQEMLGDGCLDCHLPHGSDNPWLLTVDGRALCLQCHGEHSDHQPALTCWVAGCHSQVHGSNDHALLFK